MTSVVIPLFNKESSIIATLDSVLQASSCVSPKAGNEIEVIVINDGSTDNSAQNVDQWINSSIHHSFIPSIRLINQPNGGVCSARNRGIQEAKGEYIALLDGDDLWDKDYLVEMQRMIDDFPEAAMWGVNYAETIDGQIVREVPTGLPKDFRGYVEDYFRINGRVSDLFCSSSVVIRREVFDKVGMFDERIRYAEDDDMWWRIIARYPVAFNAKYMVYYLWDADNRALQKPIQLRYYLPYFADKYAIYKDNPIFYSFIQRWCAVKIAYYYFEKKQIEDGMSAATRLDYSQISPKYRYYFSLPYGLAKLIYRTSNMYLKIKNSLIK